MPITDYNRKKQLDVDSVSGTPTVGKAQPIILTDGNDSTTGNGDIVIDFTNVNDAQDIAVYDQNGNLLDYEIEDLDTTAETGVLWCYNSWVRDGTTQAQVAYGSNSANEDRSVAGTGSNPWSNGQNAQAIYHLNESSGSTIDSTSNNNDSSSTTGTVYDASSQFNGGREGDGADDVIEFQETGDFISGSLTMVAWINLQGFTDRQNFVSFAEASGDTTERVKFGYDDNTDSGGTEALGFHMFDGSWTDIFGSTSISTNTFYHMTGTFDGSSTMEYFEDATSQGTASISSVNPKTLNLLAGNLGDNAPDFWTDGVLDAVRVYTDEKSSDWVQADYDASPKAGQVFFSQQAAEDTAAAGSIKQTGSNGVIQTNSSGVIQTTS